MAEIECDGGSHCQAVEHIHGCFAESRYANRPIDKTYDDLWAEVESLHRQLQGAVEALEAIRAELGVPGDGYSYPVAKAWKIADDFLNRSGGGSDD